MDRADTTTMSSGTGTADHHGAALDPFRPLRAVLEQFMPSDNACTLCSYVPSSLDNDVNDDHDVEIKFRECTQCHANVCNACMNGTETCAACRGVWEPGRELMTPPTNRTLLCSHHHTLASAVDTLRDMVETSQRSKNDNEPGTQAASDAAFEWYWRKRSRDGDGVVPRHRGAASKDGVAAVSKLNWEATAPDPKQPEKTFCFHRDTMLVATAYDGTKDDRLVVAYDAHESSGRKAYNIVQRDALRSFVLAAPPISRCFYVLPDGALPCDIFLDVDVNTSQYPELIGKGPEIVHTILAALDGAMSQLCQTVLGKIVVLDATREEKISYHIHARAASGACFSNVAALRRFVTWAKEKAPSDICPPAHLALIDFNSFNRYQPFRLPFCTKRGSATCVPLLFMDASAHDALRALWGPRFVRDEAEAFDLCLCTRRLAERHTFLSSGIVDLSSAAAQQQSTRGFYTNFVPVTPYTVQYDVLVNYVQSLDPHYKHVTNATIVENTGNPRYFTIKQRCSRYCTRLKREHRSTYAVFKIYYKATYTRCWSNDCTSYGFTFLRSTPENVRDAIFPPLSDEELIARGIVPETAPPANEANGGGDGGELATTQQQEVPQAGHQAEREE
eukprot:PhM_4_TR19136/c0_g1_i1/m.15103